MFIIKIEIASQQTLVILPQKLAAYQIPVFLANLCRLSIVKIMIRM